MGKSKKVMLTIASAILILIALSAVGINASYYLGNGSADAEKIAAIAVKKNNPGECAKIKVILRIMPGPSEEDLVQQCYFRVAHIFNDEKVCSYIPDGSYKNICIKDISASKNDITLCELITDQLHKGSCYGIFTEQGRDMLVCENISPNNGTQLSGRDLCYMGAVKAKPDVSICTTKIKSEHYRNQCYRSVAISTKNPTLCNRMQGNYMQFEVDDCKRYVK